VGGKRERERKRKKEGRSTEFDRGLAGNSEKLSLVPATSSTTKKPIRNSTEEK